MKRIPVTQASYKKIQGTPKTAKGVKSANVTSGKPDKGKAREASIFSSAFGGAQFGRPSIFGNMTSFYNNSYMNGIGSGALGDMPQYFAWLNEANGGVLYYPVTLKEKYEWYRYFFRVDPYVHAAICLHADLPMSKLQLRMPKMADKEKSKRIEKFYQTMIDEIKLFEKLHTILFESLIIGNCFIYADYDEKKKRWGKLVILPPEEVQVATYPMTDIKCIEYRSEMLNNIIHKYDLPIDSYEHYKEYVDSLPDNEKSILQGMNFEFVKQLKENNGVLQMDTNPYSPATPEDKIGSFVHHFAEKRHEYQELGVSPIECVLTPLLMKEHYKHTQMSLASRNMTPRYIVTAPGVSQETTDDLREQIDASMLSPDYPIVANYEVQWNTVDATNRLIDLQREYETIENQIFAGLGVTRELMTGEGMYSGSKITVEVLNTRYMLKRELLQNFVEESLFKPIALQNGFYEDDEDGNRTWFFPKIGFTRLTIRDNQEVFDQLFQLYQKGSIPIGIILDVFNLNEDEVTEKLKKDMFTPKDAVYNDMLRGIYSDIGSKISENTDLAKQIAENITGPSGKRLKYQEQQEGVDGEGDDGYGNYDGDAKNNETTFETTLEEQNNNESNESNVVQQDSNAEGVEELIDTYLKQQNVEGSNGN